VKYFVMPLFVIAMAMDNAAIKPEATTWRDVFLELSLAAFAHLVMGQHIV
jgi:Na+/H+ antiporter NhaA